MQWIENWSKYWHIKNPKKFQNLQKQTMRIYKNRFILILKPRADSDDDFYVKNHRKVFIVWGIK